MKHIYFDANNTKKSHQPSQEYLYILEKQYHYLMSFEDLDCSYNKIIKSELQKKMYSYKSQDKKTSKYDESKHITYQQLLHKLKTSKLLCYYCRDKLYLLYMKRGEPKQWSLERFNNNIGHYNSNTCISCLKCNLQRRTDNHEYFKHSKNLSIVKTSS